jgi:hypothetical protein
LESAREAAIRAYDEFDDSTPRGPKELIGWESAADAVARLCRCKISFGEIWEICAETSTVWANASYSGQSWRATRRLAWSIRSQLLRDIFGNPFRPVAFDSHWRTADVLGLARAIYDDRAFERMPILADALMDAGCENEEIINHCRGEGPHVRGCWVVDLILGKE